MPSPTINFEKELWDAANELRGAVSENNYKNYILPLVFVKHLSERYEMVHDELSSLMKDPQSDYYTKDKAQIKYTLEDHDEYKARNTFVIPRTALWQYFKDNAEQDDIKVKIDDAFDLIQDLLTAHNPQLNYLLPRIFVKSELSAKQTGGIINLLSHPKFSEKENPESDVLGQIYEYYIGRFAMAEGSGAGQFFTPGSIVRLLVEILEPYKGRIFDPACGSGGMFVQSLKFINEHGGNKSDISVYGQEMTAQTLRLCLMNLMLRNLSFDIRLGNSLLDDKFPTLKADYVIANPPFNVSTWHPEDLPEKDPRLFGPREEFTTDGSANYMWMQTFWYHLSDTGTAGIVMANGAMTSNTKGEKNVRQHMVDNSMVDAIVRLPDKLFLTTGIPACLFILSKNRDGKDGIHRKRTKEILFIDGSKLGTMVSRKLRVFQDADIAQIADVYHNWRTKGKTYADVEGFCMSATITEVQKQDYKLTPGIYVGTQAEEDDGIPFEEKMEGLKARLIEQFERGEVLKEKILNDLEKYSMEIEFINNEAKVYFNKKDNYLFRIYTFNRFIDFYKDSFVLVSPSKWSDPYEKAFLEAEYFKSNKSYHHPLKASENNRLYAQCWTASNQTEAMWKGYAPHEDGVMVKISVTKLTTLLKSISKNFNIKFYIGKVHYQSTDELYSMKGDFEMWDDIINKRINQKTLGLLLKKRQAFDFENEFRILGVVVDDVNSHDYISFPVKNLISRVEYLKIDPRMGCKMYEFVRENFKNMFPNTNIHQSRLYENPIKKLSYNGRMPTLVNDELSFNSVDELD